MKKNRLTMLILLTSLSIFTSSCAQNSSVCSNKCQEKKKATNNTEEVEIMKNTDSYNPSEQLVCKMIGAEKAEKKELLKTEIFSQVIKVEEVNNGYILNFEDKDDILLKLTDYLMIEKECCPFFIFDLNIKPNSNGISLKISGQDGAKEMLKPLIEEIQKN